MLAIKILMTFIYLSLIYIGALIYKRNHNNQETNIFLIPALTVKIIGALAAGLIYQFYYEGGDTFTFYQGSEEIWKAFSESPTIAFKLIFYKSGEYNSETYKYAQNIWTFRDPGAYMVVRIAAFFGLFTFNSYYAIALLFALVSFIGVWKLYIVLYDIYPKLYKEMAIATLFIPSVFFWGSGLFKDTITFGCLTWLTASSYYIFIKRKSIFYNILIVLICAYIIMIIKTYILLSFLPPLLFWIFLNYKNKIKSSFLQKILTPLLIIFSLSISYIILLQLGEESEKYSINNALDSASSMQRWHDYLARNEQGSGYNLEITDKSLAGILSKVPEAINVTLFRPYLWEVKNIVMLMAALESLAILFLTLKVLIKTKLFKMFSIIWSSPLVFFCTLFSLVFAFSVGFSTYNFGALVRYKIPCIPFYVISLFVILHVVDQKKNKPI